MTDRLDAAERALATQAGFEPQDGTFDVTSTPFDGVISLEPVADAVRYELEMELPTLDSVVAEETVAEVIQNGWFETFDRRLEDLDGALRADADPPTVTRHEQRNTVTVRASFESASPDHGAEDAAALVGFVEGTYMEGIIPGYTYREPVAGLLEQARERSGASQSG